MNHLSKDDLAHLRAVLLARQRELGAEVRDGTKREIGDESIPAQAGEAPDLGDSSVAVEINDLRNAEIERDANELKAVVTALARMDRGEYGVCSTCDGEIPLARLVATPAAERCIRCQTAWESQHETAGGTGI